MLQLLDEIIRVLLEGGLVAPIQRRTQPFLPQRLDIAIGTGQGIARAASDPLLQVACVQALLQVITQRGDAVPRCARFQLPTQAIGRHAQGAGGIDRRRIVLAEPGDQSGTE
ncbi:hypothetical protein FQZ97_1248410 [compost metagenome]